MAVVRTSTPLNNLREYVMTQLRQISHAKNTAYLTTPKSVERLVMAGDFAQAQKPFLRLSDLSWDAEPQTFGRLDGELSFGVHCFSENTEDPEGELHNLISDVIYALLLDVTLGAQAIHMFPRNFAPNADLTNRSGLSVTTVTFVCRYRFDTAAP